MRSVLLGGLNAPSWGGGGGGGGGVCETFTSLLKIVLQKHY